MNKTQKRQLRNKTVCVVAFYFIQLIFVHFDYKLFSNFLNENFVSKNEYKIINFFFQRCIFSFKKRNKNGLFFGDHS